MCIKLGDQIRIIRAHDGRRSDCIVLRMDEGACGDTYTVDEPLSTNGRAMLVATRKPMYKYIYCRQRDSDWKAWDVKIEVLTPS